VPVSKRDWFHCLALRRLILSHDLLLSSIRLCVSQRTKVTSCVRKTNWSARSLLRDVATSDPPVHALIDTGALITGFDNESAARFLLSHLPPYFQV
jgi:hypothetical protein